MIVLLGSKNPSKQHALEIALKELELSDYTIISCDVPSKTHSKPIGFEIIRGAENRNLALKEYAKNNAIPYDYLCSIEGGFSLDENGIPFVTTYCIMENQFGKKSTGKSLGIRLSKAMYDYVKKGESLNQLIEKINNNENNKQTLGIIGYLTNGKYNRETIDSQAVISSLIPFLYKEQRDALDELIKSGD